MKNKIIYLIIIGILLIVFGFIIGLLITHSLENVLSLGVYACHDGCSIATKDNQTGFLTNETWDCWDKCNEYIKDLIKEDLK